MIHDSKYFDRYRPDYRFANGDPATQMDYEAYSASVDNAFNFLWVTAQVPTRGSRSSVFHQSKIC